MQTTVDGRFSRGIEKVEMISQDYKLLGYNNNGERKHQVTKGVQTSLNTKPKPKPRAKRKYADLTSLSTSQSTMLIA